MIDESTTLGRARQAVQLDSDTSLSILKTLCVCKHTIPQVQWYVKVWLVQSWEKKINQYVLILRIRAALSWIKHSGYLDLVSGGTFSQSLHCLTVFCQTFSGHSNSLSQPWTLCFMWGKKFGACMWGRKAVSASGQPEKAEKTSKFLMHIPGRRRVLIGQIAWGSQVPARAALEFVQVCVWPQNKGGWWYLKLL